MSIKRMLLLAATALAAIAYAAPAAQAGITMIEPTNGNKKVEKNAEVTLTSTNLVTTGNTGVNLECELVTIHAKVLVAHGTAIVLQLLSTTTQNCSTNAGHFVTITDEEVEIANLSLNEEGTGETTASFAAELFFDEAHEETIVECAFSSPAEGEEIHVQATVGTDVIHVAGPLVGSPSPPCASEAEIHGTFTIETSDSTEIQFEKV